jgi:hypothetical protein
LVHTLRQGFFAQILAPLPAGHVDVDGVLLPIHADIAIAAHHDRAQVAGFHFVDAYQLGHGIRKLIGGETDVFHAVDFGRIHHAANVLPKTENRRAGRRRVAPDAFEYAAAIADHVRKDVNLRVIPINEAAVMPDLFSGLQHG